jgi:hypothetical protein
VARAALFGLEGEASHVLAQFHLDGRLNVGCLMADYHDNAMRFEFGSCAANMSDQRTSVELVQNLRQVRLHTGAQSGSEHENIQR